MEKFEIEQLKCIDTDPTLSANSDKKIPTQKAVKTLVENNRLQFIISLTGDSGALTQEQLDIVSDNYKNYVLFNDGQVFSLVNANSNLSYKTYLNMDVSLSENIEAKAIYIQLNPLAANYGRWTKEDIVVVNAYTKTESDGRYATTSQGAKADTALQPSDLSATSPIAYNSTTKTISVASGYQIPITAQVSQIATNTNNISTNTGNIANINALIPSAASSSNQLVDHNLLNSSLNSLAAFYITRTAAGDQFATKAQLDATTTFYYDGAVRVPTKNDYCIVVADETKTDPITGEDPTTRYIYLNNSWQYQYTVNKTTLTAAQLAAVNSGITSALVAKIGTALQPNDNISNLNNNAGYITGIDSAAVVAALGFTPYNATNPSGYQTAAQLSSYVSSNALLKTTKYAADLSYVNNELQLKDQDGNNIGGSVVISASGTWGGIGGTLSNQTDLKNALDSKSGVVLSVW